MNLECGARESAVSRKASKKETNVQLPSVHQTVSLSMKSLACHVIIGSLHVTEVCESRQIRSRALCLFHEALY